MVLAIAEMGDVNAHFGNWGPATSAWNDALDTLLGPYQVQLVFDEAVVKEGGG